jgi:hypothetical protein
VQIGVSTWSSQALWDGAGSRQKGLGFSLCAVPSQLAGPHISGLGGVGLRRSPGGVDDIVKDQDQRFEVRGGDGGGGGVGVGVISQRYQNFAKRSRESDQVVDSIFELKSIHAGEVAYKQSRTIGGYFGETREAEQVSG